MRFMVEVAAHCWAVVREQTVGLDGRAGMKGVEKTRRYR